MSNVRDAYDYAVLQVESGAGAVIVTHGTDTLEESALLFDLWWDRPEPVVFTGAMRSSDQPGPDGPANLYAAVAIALSENSRNRSVLVVMNDEIFEARNVCKVDTFSPAAFRAINGAAIGRFIEGTVHWNHQRPSKRIALPAPINSVSVALIGAGLSEDGSYLPAIANHVDGLVVDGVGAGHVSAACADVLESLNASIPVVVASRTGHGPTGTRTYGYLGAEVDLLRRGIMLTGYLSAVQARVVLLACLAAGLSASEIQVIIGAVVERE